ncbi:hypothetical protein V9T40_002712 [Parthenolecanium corni]|uniref:Uncharacterized protein n=1 Tax=Parthenolecanium corni TaxID=536013 RepID=A0AAN9TIX3_9HEMI
MWENTITRESWRYAVQQKKNQSEPYTDAEVKRISKLPWFLHLAACTENSIFGKNFVKTKVNAERLDLFTCPESGILVPGIRYGRAFADILTVKNPAENEDANESMSQEHLGNYTLLYEPSSQISLREYSLYDFLMDEFQPRIEAYIDCGQKQQVQKDIKNKHGFLWTHYMGLLYFEGSSTALLPPMIRYCYQADESVLVYLFSPVII